MAILVTEGKEWLVDKVQDVAPLSNALGRFIGWGTGVVAEAVGNTFANTTEASEARTTGTLAQPTTTTDRVTGTIVATGTKSITEVMRTNTATKADAGQRLIMRALFTAVPVENLDSIAFTLDIVNT